MANSGELIVATALANIIPGRVYPDIAPANAVRPYITYQQAGGQSPNIMNGGIGIQNSRMQVNVWAESRAAAGPIMQNIIAALSTDAVKASTIGAPVSIYEPDTKLYGSRSDFSIWYYP